MEQLWKCKDCNDHQATEALDEEGCRTLVCLKCINLKVFGLYDKDGHPEYLNCENADVFKLMRHIR